MRKYTDTHLGVHSATLASLGAGIVHVAAAPGHWDEWRPAGAFFIALAVFQVAWAVIAYLVPHSRWIILAVPVNLGAIAVWAVSRIWAVPAGPSAGAPEAVGLADVVATFLEVFIAATVLWALVPRLQRAALHAAWYRTAIAGTAAWVALLVGPSLIAVDSHSHTEGDGEHGHGSPTEQPTDGETVDEPAPSKPGDTTSPVEPGTPDESSEHAETPHEH